MKISRSALSRALRTRLENVVGQASRLPLGRLAPRIFAGETPAHRRPEAARANIFQTRFQSKACTVRPVLPRINAATASSSSAFSFVAKGSGVGRATV